MAKYINKETAIAVIEEKQKELCPVGRYGRNYVYGSDRDKYDAWDEIIDALENIPSADVAPVVHKQVVGYEGLYEVDQFGRVYGIDRTKTVVDNVRIYEKPIAGRQMKQSMHTKGYKTVSLTKNGSTKTMFVHRIVAEAFLPNPNNLPMVNHKDEDKTNNFIDNLEWCTASYNRTYGKAIERQAKKIRGRKSKKKIAVIQKNMSGEFLKWFDSLTKAAENVNGSTSSISAVCKGKRKMAYGYLWEYDFCSDGERKDEANES